MNNLHDKPNRLEIFWPDTFTERGRRIARNEGIAAALFLAGQYLVGLDAIIVAIGEGATNLDIYKTGLGVSLVLLLFFAWRIYRWSLISAGIIGLWALAEFALVSIKIAQPPVWNTVVLFLAFQGIRGCLAEKKHRKTVGIT